MRENDIYIQIYSFLVKFERHHMCSLRHTRARNQMSDTKFDWRFILCVASVTIRLYLHPSTRECSIHFLISFRYVPEFIGVKAETEEREIEWPVLPKVKANT